MDLEPGDLGGDLSADGFRVDFAFDKGFVHYLRDLTPMRNAKGRGTIAGTSLTIDAERADVGDMQLVAGLVHIPKLGSKKHNAEFSGTVEGKSSDILELIDMEPLKLTRKIDLNPQEVGGTARASFKVARPMRRRVPIEVVHYEATADVKDLTLPDVLGDLSFENGTLNLDIDKSGIVGKGGMDLAGVPAKLEWKEAFNAGSSPSTTYLISIDAEADEYAKLGYPLGGIIKGPLRSQIRTYGKGMNIQKADISGNFTDAIMDLSGFHYFKEVGRPGQVSFQLELDDTGDRKFSNIKLDGEALTIRGEMELADNLSLTRAAFPEVKMAEDMDLSVRANRQGTDQRLTIEVNGKAL